MRHTFLALVVWLTLFAGCKKSEPQPREQGKKILNMALRTTVGTLDPVRCSTQNENMVQSAILEPLFQYNYLKRPYQLEPNLAASMPEVSDDLLAYTFTLKKGVHFHDDPAFPEGRGREVVAGDVIYSMKRMANKEFLPNGWWLYNQRIVGFDAYKKEQEERAPGKSFDYDKAVEGLEVLDRHRFRVRLVRPFPQFLNVLSMCYANVIAREVVDHYGQEIGRHPVGTGPFLLRELTPGTKVVLERNPNYRDEKYPAAADAEPGDVERGLVADAGKRIPFLDGIVMHVFEQDQPMWLKWRVGDLDFIHTPAEYFDSAFDKNNNNRLQEALVKENVGSYSYAKIDFIFRGFNMEDPIVGGFGSGKWVRQAMSLAIDTHEIADAFYNNTVVRYDGPIPPGLDGYTPGVISPYRGPNVERAKELLARAGYPDGKGLPALQYHTNRGGTSPEQSEMIRRQLKRIGVELVVNLHSFPELDEMMKKKKAQIFNYSWGSDYPDAENNLALFYGPNTSPGANSFNYRNPDYDALYEQIRSMAPSAERTVLYQKMRDILIEDCPAIGSMARTRYWVWNARARNLKPDETWYSWVKYVDVEPR